MTTKLEFDLSSIALSERLAAVERMREVRYRRWEDGEKRSAIIYGFTIEQTTDRRPARQIIDKIIEVLDSSEPKLRIAVTMDMPRADAYLVSDYLSQCVRSRDFEPYSGLISALQVHWDRALRVRGTDQERIWIMSEPDSIAAKESALAPTFSGEVQRRQEEILRKHAETQAAKEQA